MSNRKQTWKAAVSAAAIAAGAAIPMAANAAWSEDTYTTITNGVTWTYVVDEEAGKIMLGKGTGSHGAKMVSTSTAGVLYIPTTLAHGGTTYNVTDYAYGGLSSCASLKGVVFPETTFAQIANGAALFQSMGACKAIWWKGPNTVASGTQPVSKVGGGTQLFRYDHSLKAVVLGPNVTYGYVAGTDYPLFKDTQCDVSLFIPKARWTAMTDNRITNSTTKGECKIIRYGPGEDIDVSIDGKFTVTTAERLDDVLSVANDLHDYCGMNPRIAVTNTIEFTDGLITADRMRFATFSSLMFSAKTQTQLNAILAAVPSSVPVSIDPTGLTENMTIPDDYPNVFVKTVPGVTIKRTTKGFMLVVK